MVKGLNVNLVICDNDTKQYYPIPVLPETILYECGDALKDTVKIINLGNVDFPSGVDLDSISWSSFFPARYDSGYCMTSNMFTPLGYRGIFEMWKNKASSLQVICAAAGINKNMTLNSFKPELAGFEGDIYYKATFKERRIIKPIQVELGATIPQVAKPGLVSRDPAVSGSIPGTYTVQTGDTLYAIAKRYSIPDWHTLYEKNRSAVGTDPNKLYVGQVLTL